MEQYDIDFRNTGIEHTFAVVHFSTLLAKQKNERLDLAQIASYLHDIAYYTSHYEGNHAKRSADMAKTILEIYLLLKLKSLPKRLPIIQTKIKFMMVYAKF